MNKIRVRWHDCASVRKLFKWMIGSNHRMFVKQRLHGTKGG